MFADHLPKIDEVPNRMLFLAAAALVILCQLAAMALVVDGQVNSAQVRDALRVSERTAINRCMETSLGTARHNCIQQAKAAKAAKASIQDGQSTQALADTEESDITALPANPVQGFLPVSFAPRQ
ncbi:hypothetical protein [Polaromonas sp.]|uniref:hypothetical protein n=1 Tax=Polaromonas sp. TaxID=1869339 RepID=UPI0017BC0028|nr:hypothetical protein [Polaromonas sp.]NMM08411.1 hypothetical protein [Polaromonas sp.]